VPPLSRTGVFISYARSDGEAIARDLRHRLESTGVPLWRDREQMEGGRDWWLQITAALDAVEFLLLVMTPAALASALVRREWRYARQRGVCVYPVKGSADIDFEALPRWMRSVHFYDLAYEWPKLLNDLRTRCERRRVPFMVEELPSEFVPRPSEFDRLLSHVLDREREEPIAITTALRAAGGYGKTVLARALCHHEDVQNAFDDGILWVTLGEDPGDLTGRVEDLIYVLSGDRPGFAHLEPATSVLAEMLADRDILLVIDDLWDIAHLKPFIQGGPRCARVITTRMLDALPPDASRVDVDAMQQSEAVALLGYGLPPGFERDLQQLAGRLGEWPLLLKLANAALRDRVQTSGQSPAAALAYVNRALDKRGFTFFDARDPVARHQAVARTVDLSIERLTETERARFTELAVFPEDVTIPLTTIQRLWERTGGLDDFETEVLCERLHRLSLVLAFDPTQRFVRLHDVIRQYLMRQLGEPLVVAVHRQLLDAHRPASGVWADMPQPEPYLWDHLAYHLRGAGQDAELVATALDLSYLAAKTLARTALAAERDLVAVEERDPANDLLPILRRSFVQAGHILNRCTRREDLEATLQSRLQQLQPLRAATTRLAARLAVPHLRSVAAFPDLPHSALIRTYSGSGQSLWGCAVSPDGLFIVSTAYDGTVSVWDTRTSMERLRLTGHTGWVRRCAVSPDASFIVSASYDRRLRVWDAQNGSLVHVLAGHTDAVTDCAVSPDGTFIVSASLDETVRIWDAATGSLRRTLSAQWGDERSGWIVRRTPWGHLAAVWSCAVSPDGARIASASSDQTVKVWDAHTGEELRTFTGHTSMVVSCTFSPDGVLLASAGADGTVRLWECGSGAVRAVFAGHERAVSACAFGPDGSWLVSAADRIMKIWDVATALERASYSGHTDLINDCAVSPDGSYVVSVSIDGTHRLWETSKAHTTTAAGGHTGWVNGCAVNDEGLLAASASADNTVRTWTARTGEPRSTLVGHTGSVRCCVFGPANAYLRYLPLSRSTRGKGIMQGWSWRRYLVSASTDRSLKVWDLKTGLAVATLLGHTDWMNACSVSPDGRLVLSASSDKTFRLWDVGSRWLVGEPSPERWRERLRVVAHADSLNACRFDPAGTYFVSASADATLKVWATKTVEEAWESLPLHHRRLTERDWNHILTPRVLEGHDASVNDCEVAADSSFIVSASSDRTLRVWDAQTGTTRRTLSGHRSQVLGCAISPDGSRIVSTSADSTIRIWSVSRGECETTLYVDSVLEDCVWMPDGRGVVAAGAAGVYFMTLVVAAPERVAID
jgi:WD40 repeat protein